MVGVLAVGFIANLLVKPVDSRFHEPEGAATEAVREFAEGEQEGSVARGGSVRVYLSWGVMVLLLAYGVFQTLQTAAKLFG